MAFKNTLCCAMVVTFWSSAFVGVQVVMASMPSGEFVLYRLTISSLVLGFLQWRENNTPFKGRDRFKVALSGIFGSTAYCTFLNSAQAEVTSAESCLVINTMPVFSAVMGWILFKKKCSFFAVLGLVVSLFGIAIITYGKMEREFHLSTGLISLLCASLSLAMSTVIQKELLQRYTPLQVIGTGIICGCIASIPLGWSLMDNYLQLPVETHLLIAYLAIFPSALAYLAWGYLLKHCETYQVASLLYIVPCGTAVFAYVWIGEILTGFTLLGGVISILGVALTQISRTQSRLFQRCLASSLRRNVITYR